MNVSGNVATWSPEFLSGLKADAERSLAAFTIGDRRALDRAELIVHETGTKVEGSKTTPFASNRGAWRNRRKNSGADARTEGENEYPSP